MKNRLLNICLIAFSLLMCLFPTIYLLNNMIIICITGVILITMFILLSNKINELLNKHKSKYLLIIVALSLITRITSAIILSKIVIPWSDFEIAYNNAVNLEFNTLYYHIANHWLLLPVILSVVFKLFGQSYLTAYLFVAIVQIITLIFLYFCSSEFFKSKKLGFISTILYMFIPSNIIYISQLTPEHLSIMFLVISLYLLLKYLNKEEMNFKSHLLLFGSGITFALSSAFKDFHQVIFISAIICIFLYFLKNDLAKTKKIIIAFIMIFLSFTYTRFYIYDYMDSIVNSGYKVNRNSAPNYLNVGLNSKGTGGHNKRIYAEYDRAVIKNNYNYDVVNKMFMDNLKEDIIKNYKKLPTRFNWKAKMIFNQTKLKVASKLDCVVRSLQQENGKEKYIDMVKNYALPINAYYVFALNILMIIGLINIFKKKDIRSYLLYISYFGASLMLLLIEPQARYMYVFDVFVVLMSINGIKYMYTKFNKKNNIKNESKDISIIKGILALLLVLVNISPEYFRMYGFSNFISYINVILISTYLVVCGYNVKKHDKFRDCIIYQLKTYLYPWLFYTILFTLISKSSFTDIFYGNNLIFKLFYVVPLLFLVEILYYFIDKYLEKTLYKVIIMFTSFLLSILLIKYVTYDKCIFMHFDYIGIFNFYYLLGYFINKYKKKFINNRVCILTAILTIIMMFIILNNYYIVNKMNALNCFIIFLTQISLIVFVLNIVDYINNFNFLEKVLDFVGNNFITILMTNAFLYYSLLSYTQNGLLLLISVLAIESILIAIVNFLKKKTNY